ncbi:Panacea domain-containing protein [Magnetospirillum molischianum]|uniref:Phage-associated protein n=1 Tax=Magnetospirillum molischianum DSM 120 TaxID=1150626 RepID=H8FTX0_MAGML|nr:type II toxin-antitoxin system antitoxin SocA domain-containing protein [Magnetospirillum molischianum]CCG41827.1 Phage-associated protein [Magnetospirillum molischianum DSM 120]
MADVRDVAAFILRQCGEMTAMKLQKLVYYAQVWSLVWDERPLFPQRIEAWANGPVCPDLYRLHQGLFRVGPHEIPGNPDEIDGDGQDTIRGVLNFYSDKSAQWLSDLSHQEAPWRDSRAGLADGDRGSREITHAAMAEYYGGLS